MKREGQNSARVIACSRGEYTIAYESNDSTSGVVMRAILAGVYRGKEKSIVPVVGDHVHFKETDKGGKVIITGCEQRTTHLSRKPAISGGRRLKNGVITGGKTEPQVLAANVDIVFIVCGLDGDFNLHRIERYLMVARSGGVKPVILLNKADLCTEAEARMKEVEEMAAGISVHMTDTISSGGLDDVMAYIQKGVTVAFLGSSGVGKSTIINRLFGESIQATGATNENTGKGRHTTTLAGLFPHPSGAYLIDTPGIRELRPWCDERTVDESFADIAEIIATCRYSDCSHTNEPGCALKEALDSGELESDRYGHYLKLLGETRELSIRRAQWERYQAARGKRR